MRKSGLNLSVLTTSTVLFLLLQLVFEAGFIPLSTQPTHLPKENHGTKDKEIEIEQSRGFSKEERILKLRKTISLYLQNNFHLSQTYRKI